MRFDRRVLGREVDAARGRRIALAALAVALAGALYEPPVAGTYELPPIDRVEAREPRGSSGPRALSTARRGAGRRGRVRVSRLSRGERLPASLALCASSTALESDPARAARVRLACVSFDPANDTPERMRELREMMALKTDWAFLSGPGDPAAPAALLVDYGQDATPLENGAFRHVLKVFLIDDQLRVRNVYSAGLLDPALVIADIDTVTLGLR
jgi:hypothetical protein